jgi:hypothetical protein
LKINQLVYQVALLAVLPHKLTTTHIGDNNMNRKDILKLQKIVDGQTFQESIIDDAIELANSLDLKVALKALKGGYISTDGRFTISQFIVELLREKKQ